ncbi:MAG: hypothetical protein LKJ89_01300, partial [Sphaerochaeta sp.]|nr:hypothetical protein [Sphaerochaeta sp.]
VSSRLSQISDLQNADTAEIVDCCQCIDEALACRLLRKAEKAQLSFTYAQVAEFAVFIGDEGKYSGGIHQGLKHSHLQPLSALFKLI